MGGRLVWEGGGLGVSWFGGSEMVLQMEMVWGGTWVGDENGLGEGDESGEGYGLGREIGWGNENDWDRKMAWGW